MEAARIDRMAGAPIRCPGWTGCRQGVVMATPTCSSCRTEMQIGFVPEAAPGGFYASVWFPGEASKDKKTWGERISSPGGVRYSHDEALMIDAWRCAACGRVELFATRKAEAGKTM